jgi:ribosome-binding factor A
MRPKGNPPESKANMSETVVQKKISRLVQKELSEIIRLGSSYSMGTMVTISIVRITADLGLAKVYVSVFPEDKLLPVVDHLNANVWEIRKSLAQRIRNKLRKMPEVAFYADDTLQEVERMEKILKDLNIPADTDSIPPSE